MAYFPIQVAGGTYKHTDLSLSAQRTINFWPQKQDSGNSRSNYVIESFYGLKSFSTGTGLDRGMFVHQNILYKLTGTTLNSVDSAGALTSIGTIPGDSRAVFAGFGSDTIIIVADDVAYTWDGSTFTTASDGDFETPQTVAVINNQAIYDGDDARFAVSDVGAALTINALNYGTAEFVPDTIVRPYSFMGIVYMFCQTHFEQWWNNTSVSNPPFSRIEGSSVNIGLAAQNSLANDDAAIYMLGDDSQVYRLNGPVATPILPKVIAREIEGFTTKSDAIGWTMIISGQWFYVLKFTAEDRTFIYPRGGEWFELSSGTLGARYNGNSYAFAYGKHLIADEDGDIFELDPDTYDENGSKIRRVRTLAPVHGGLFGQPGKEIEISFLKLVGKTGTGIVSSTTARFLLEQGSDAFVLEDGGLFALEDQTISSAVEPHVILQYSPDGENFSTEIWGDVGKMGQLTEIIFDVNDAHENWIFRIISSDAVYSNWHSAGIEAELCI